MTSLDTLFDAMQAVVFKHGTDSDSGFPASQILAFMSMSSTARTAPTDVAYAAIAGYLAALPIDKMSYGARSDLAALVVGIDGMPSLNVDAESMVKEARNAMVRGRFNSTGMELPPPDPEPTAEDIEREKDEEGGWQTIDFAPEPERPAGAPTNPSRIEMVNFFAPMLVKAFVDACSRLPQGADGRDVVVAIKKAAESDNPVFEIAYAFQKYSTLLAQAVPMVCANTKLRDAIEAADMPPEVVKRALGTLDMVRSALGSGATGIGAMVGAFYHLILSAELPPPPLPEVKPEDAADPMAEAFGAAGWSLEPADAGTAP
jgi:hypothetical protein